MSVSYARTHFLEATCGRPQLGVDQPYGDARRVPPFFLAYDLYPGRVDESHEYWPYLMQNGATVEALQWLREHGRRAEILGVNVYPWGGGR